MAIARADFAVKPPLTACAISWIQFFTYLEIKRNRSQEFENDKSSDLCAERRDESYDEVGLL